MKAKLKLDDGREIEVEITAEELEKLTEKEFPQIGDTYYAVNRDGVSYFEWDDGRVDYYQLIIGNCFETYQQAKDAERALALIEKIRKERKELNRGHEKWLTEHLHNENIAKYSIGCELSSMHLLSWSFGLKYHGNPFGFYADRKSAEKIIENNRSELEWFFTKYCPSIN